MITKKNKYTNLTINSTCPRCKDGKLVDKSVWRKRILRCPTCYVEYYFKLDLEKDHIDKIKGRSISISDAIEEYKEGKGEERRSKFPEERMSMFDIFSLIPRPTEQMKKEINEEKWVNYLMEETHNLIFIPVNEGSLCLFCEEGRLLKESRNIIICSSCLVEYQFILAKDLIHKHRLSHVIFTKEALEKQKRYRSVMVKIGDVCPVCTDGCIDTKNDAPGSYVLYCPTCNVQFLKLPKERRR